MDNNNVRVDLAVKVLMVERGINAFTLASETNLNRATIFRTVGKGCNPKLNNLTSIAGVLKVKVSDIMLLAEKYGEKA